MWRYRWEEAQNATVKEALLRYNQEDCLAAMTVFDHLTALSQPTDVLTIQCMETDALPSRRGETFGKTPFALPGMEAISKLPISIISRTRCSSEPIGM